ATRTNMPRCFASAMPARGPCWARAAVRTSGRRPARRPLAGQTGASTSTSTSTQTSASASAIGLERQAKTEASVERPLVQQGVAVVRVLLDRRARDVLRVLQVRRRAVHDRAGPAVRVVVVGHDDRLLV